MSHRLRGSWTLGPSMLCPSVWLPWPGVMDKQMTTGRRIQDWKPLGWASLGLALHPSHLQLGLAASISCSFSAGLVVPGATGEPGGSRAFKKWEHQPEEWRVTRKRWGGRPGRDEWRHWSQTLQGSTAHWMAQAGNRTSLCFIWGYDESYPWPLRAYTSFMWVDRCELIKCFAKYKKKKISS
jgi:hypothetical protein